MNTNSIMARPLLFGAFILGIMSEPASGQINFSAGITGGLNFATFGGNDLLSPSSITQYAVGAFAEIGFPMVPISIQPEVLYSVKGSNDNGSVGTHPVSFQSSFTDKYSYIDVPVLFEYYLPTQFIRPFVFVGPSVGFLVNAKEEERVYNDGHFLGQIESDVKNRTASADVGAVVGSGCKIPCAILDFTLDARYDLGFTSLDKNGSAKIYNRVISVYFGVAI